MPALKTVVQLFTGRIQSPGDACLADVRDKLDAMFAVHPPYALVTGWSPNRRLYEELARYLEGRGTRLFLWFPAFAELGAVAEFAPLLGTGGEPVRGRDFRDQDKFLFYCPSVRENIENALAVYDRFFVGLPFDGVFLDRVRYPSFIAGVDGVFSCFCPHCLAEYEALGLDGEALRAAAERAKARVERGGENPLGLVAFTEAGWRCEDPLLTAFFDARCRLVAKGTAALGTGFAQRGLTAAFDLFTPSLGWFAGQGFQYLLPLAEFVKPMLYRYTDGPAGIPYELGVYGRAMGSGKAAERALLRLLGVGEVDGYRELVERELALMLRLRAGLGVRPLLLPGMETNDVPIARITPERVSDAVRTLARAGADGMTASWSLLTTPPENLAAFLAALAAGERG